MTVYIFSGLDSAATTALGLTMAREIVRVVSDTAGSEKLACKCSFCTDIDMQEQMECLAIRVWACGYQLALVTYLDGVVDSAVLIEKAMAAIRQMVQKGALRLKVDGYRALAELALRKNIWRGTRRYFLQHGELYSERFGALEHGGTLEEVTRQTWEVDP